MRVVAPSARRSVAPLRRTPVSKSLLCAYPRVLPRLQRINAPRRMPGALTRRRGMVSTELEEVEGAGLTWRVVGEGQP